MPKPKEWIKIILMLWIFVVVVAKYDAACSPKEKADEPAAIVSEIVVDIQEIKGDVTPWVDLVTHLIFIQKGEPFSTKRFKDSLEALKSSGIFKIIHVFETSVKKDQLALHFQVTPYLRIKDIKISNAFPLLEREILNAMQMHVGDTYHPDMISTKETAVVRLFKEQGYIAPMVQLGVTEDSSDGSVKVHVNIQKGDFFHIRHFDINGNRAFSKMRLKWRINTYKSWWIPKFLRRFKKKEFDKDIKNLIRFYRKKEYPDVVVNAEVKKDIKTQDASITLKIDEGSKYDITFEGNKAFWDFSLKKDLVLFKDGNKKDFGLRKSMRKIKERYFKKGYKECRIEMKSEKTQDAGQPVRKIRFIIHEGPQYIVNSVNFKGNHTIGSKEIKKEILTRPPGLLANGALVQETLEEDKRAITSLYLKHGFMNMNVKDQIESKKDTKEKKQNIDLTMKIEEGVQTYVTSVTINGLNALSESKAREVVALKKGSVFRNYMIRSDENTLSSLISEKGFPHVNVRGTTTFNKGNTEAAVTYEVDEGPLVKMGQTAYTGNFFTKRRVIQNELELDPGEPFSLKKFLISQRNIRDIEALESVRFYTFGLKEKADSVNQFLELEEKKPYYIQTGGGYDTEKGFNANILSGDRNLFGLNKDAWAGGEISQIGYRGDLGMLEPRFFGTRIKTALNMFAETREEFNTQFGTRERGVSLSFSRRFFEKFNADISFVYSYRKDYTRDDFFTFIDEENRFESREILTISPSIVYNSIDSYIRPKKGIFSSLLMDISNGIKNSRDDFFRYRFEVRKYYTLIENFSVALRGRVGDITPLNSADTVPADQLFFLGGTSTVRGFEENLLRFDVFDKAVGGLTAILGNIETRIDLGDNFEFSLFYDIGSVRNALIDQGSDEFRSSIGLGIHYFTPIGPIGAYYGHKLDRKTGESAGRFHFTIGFRF